MPSTNENHFLFPAWGISLALHGVAVWLALAFAAQVKPVLEEEVFKWDVALVQSAELDKSSEPAEPVIRPGRPQVRVAAPPPAEPQAGTTMHRVAPPQTVQMIEAVKPIEQKLEPLAQFTAEPVPPVEQNLVEVAKPKVERVVEAKEPEPVQHAETLVAQSPSVAVPASAEPVEAQPSHHESPTPASPASPSHEAEKNVPAISEASGQVAKATAPASEAKADHRWLAESLWRRVAELKRYPSSARLNGQEGKVILKAVIRSDGQLAEVSVQKSSGHTILDAAAIEAVKLACPLYMKHAISKPEIVVSLPIVYSLAN
jgi:periplasmic protein TonB